MGLFESIPVEQHGMSEWTLVLAIIGIVVITFVVKWLFNMITETQTDVDRHTIEIRDLRENNVEIFTTVKNIDQKISTMLHDAQELNALVIEHLIETNKKK